ncbi:hypothetical protein CcCBS67573_g03216 [Chytriomyces confervae]|uniref:Uncharacterized protein n=1 Tax=Chytriomyces confervae TaxID=246404 RepID=A0A507FJN2_9FUNG|nr:hypothetical protein CcCBS67573_g03216 [Chytriomyces confervae]
MNRVFFVQYQTNQPVKIETHYVGEQERRRPLEDVADMVGAFFLGQYNLHAVVDGVEGPALKPDLPLSTLSAGLTAKNALVIKSKSDMGTHASQVSGPCERRTREAFVVGNLRNTEDVLKFLQHKINLLAPFNPDKPYHATFLDNCLEFRLDRRQTTHSLDASDNIKVLVSISGSGKTRQLLELLYSQFGYFFVVGLQQQADFGSGDLLKCDTYSAYNPKKAQYFIELLYFAFFGCDLFSKLYDSLACHTSIDVGRSTASIERWFDFVAMDQIQASLGGEHIYTVSGGKPRPFFSPLVYHFKHMGRFHKFIVAGTAINFDYLNELLCPGTMNAHQVTAHDVISDLKPLDKGQAESYIRLMLSDHNIRNDQIREVVDLVCSNPLFLGRGRFITFILDSILGGGTVYLAVSKFVKVLSQPESSLSPLKCYMDDIQYYNRNSFDTVVGEETLGETVRRGLIQYLMKGEATLMVEGQVASDMVRYGLGFCTVVGGSIQSVELKELATIEYLRYIIPVSDLVPDICVQLASFPRPQMVEYVLECLVGYALVAGLDINRAKTLKSTHGNFARYLNWKDENAVLFPDPFCGPDVVYKYEGTVYTVQVKFVDQISKQDRLNACHTTDPDYFYWNKKSGRVFAEFHERRESILKKLKESTCKRLVFLHTTTEITAEMDGVEIT